MMQMVDTRHKLWIAAMIVVASLASVTYSAESPKPGSKAQASRGGDPVLEQGRYLMKIGGCNDCHTSKWSVSGGTVAEAEWLSGDTIGWRGPWGTTYARNLRQFFQNLTEDQWVTWARSAKTAPPMPWWALNAMKERDLRAMYRFVKSLGPSDKQIPATVPPGKEPTTPYFILSPQSPKAEK